jgi:NRPS condensation-like uncharacterized protein
MSSNITSNKSFRRDAFYERNHFFVPGDNVIVAFQITGKITESQLQNGIQLIRTIHPMIGVHIEFDEEKRAWFVSDNTPPCSWKIIPRENDRTWIQAVLAEYWEPFQISKGPLVRFLLVEGNEFSDLVVIAQHAICDGLSLVYLLRDLMTAVGCPDKELLPQNNIPTIKEVYNLNKIKLNPLIKKIVPKINQIWKQYEITFDEKDYHPMYEAFQAHKLNALKWELTKDVTMKLVERCHQEKISVNSALYCAILYVQYQLQGDRDKFRRNIMMPVNIRNLVSPPIGEGVGLFAGGEAFPINMKWKNKFWDEAHKVHIQLQKHLSPDSIFSTAKKVMLFEPSFMDARTMMFLGALIPTPPPKYQELMKIVEKARLLKKIKSKSSNNPIQLGSVLTNLGILSIPEVYGKFRLENVVLMPPNSPLAEKLIGVVTFQNRLQGTMAFAEKTLNPEMATQFVTKLVDFIKNQL